MTEPEFILAPCEFVSPDGWTQPERILQTCNGRGDYETWWHAVGTPGRQTESEWVGVGEWIDPNGNVYYAAVAGSYDHDALFANCPRFSTWQEAMLWVKVAGHTVFDTPCADSGAA